MAQVTVGTNPNSATVKIDWPTIYYAAIDVSSDVQGDSDVEHVLLGEDGSVIFSYRGSSYEGDEDCDPGDEDDKDDPALNGVSLEGTDEAGGVEYHVHTWHNGQPPDDQTAKFRTYKVYHHDKDPSDDNDESFDVTFNYDTAVGAVNLSGQLFASKHVMYYGGTALSNWVISGGAGSMRRSQIPQPPYATLTEENQNGYPNESLARYQVACASDNGNNKVICTKGYRLAVDSYLNSITDNFGYIDSSGNATVFDVISNTWSVQDFCNLVPEVPSQINNNGYAIVGKYIWTGTDHIDLGDDVPQDLNNSNQVVVKSDEAADDGSNSGYLWEDGTKTYLRDKLPKYLQAQVTDIQPLMISEEATDGTICILGWVMEGDDDPGSYVVCTRDSSGNWSFVKAVMSGGLNIGGINSEGTIVDIARADSEGLLSYTLSKPHTNQASGSTPVAVIAKATTFSVTTTEQGDFKLSPPDVGVSPVPTLWGYRQQATISIPNLEGGQKKITKIGIWRDISYTDTVTFQDNSHLVCISGWNGSLPKPPTGALMADTGNELQAVDLNSNTFSFSLPDRPSLPINSPAALSEIKTIKEQVRFQWFAIVEFTDRTQTALPIKCQSAYTSFAARIGANIVWVKPDSAMESSSAAPKPNESLSSGPAPNPVPAGTRTVGGFSAPPSVVFIENPANWHADFGKAKTYEGHFPHP